MKNLSRDSRVAIGHGYVRPQLAIGVSEVAICPRHRRQTRAASANEPLSFSRGDPSVEGPTGDLRIVRLGQSLRPPKTGTFCVARWLQPSVRFERIRDDGFHQAARKDEREARIAALER